MIDMGIAILLAAVFIMVTMAMTAADFELNLLSTAWTASATSNIEVRPCTPRPNGMDTYIQVCRIPLLTFKHNLGSHL